MNQVQRSPYMSGARFRKQKQERKKSHEKKPEPKLETPDHDEQKELPYWLRDWGVEIK